MPLKYLESMFVASQGAGLTLKPSNLSFGPKSVVSLGHVISAEGVAVENDRIKAIQELQTPTCIKDLRSVVGVIHFVRRFVPNFVEATAPLVDLTRMEFATRSRLKISGVVRKVVRLPT